MRLRPLLLATALAALVVGPLPGFDDLVELESALRATRSTSRAERRRACDLLLDRAPRLLIADLLEAPGDRVTTLTGDYIRCAPRGAPPWPVSVVPSLRGMSDAGEPGQRILEPWAAACLGDGATASRTADVVAATLRRDGHDPGACFVLTLSGANPGFRRMAYEWLVAHEGFPRDHDWRAPTERELLVTRRRPRAAIDAAVMQRERFLTEWARSRPPRR